MPFTLAHPIVIVPLRRFRWLPLSALVIGSMTPDFSHVVLFSWRAYHLAHSWRGMVVLDLPVGIATFLLFHWFLKRPLLTLLPARDADVLSPVAETRWPLEAGTCLGIVAALLIGAFSHIALDSFTHGTGWTVRHCAALGATTALIGLPVFKMLQYGISVIGCVALAMLYLSWRRQQPWPTPKPFTPLWPVASRRQICFYTLRIFALGLFVSVIFSTCSRHGLRMNLAPRRVVSDIICGTMAWCSTARVAYAAAWHWLCRRPHGSRN